MGYHTEPNRQQNGHCRITVIISFIHVRPCYTRIWIQHQQIINELVLNTGSKVLLQIVNALIAPIIE